VARIGTGWGHFKFGNFPWGKADFGRDVVTRNMPEPYLLNNDGTDNELLQHYLFTLEDSVNRSKQQIDNIPDQVDFDRVRKDILAFLGSTIDVVIDDSEPEEFQRSLVGNAIQFYRIKGTLASYRIRGKISGFDVTVDNLYKLAPDLVPFFDIDNLFEVPPGSGTFFTILPPGSVSGVSGISGVSGDDRLSGFSCDYCLTAFIKLNFQVVKTLPPAITGEGNFFDRVAAKLRDIIPIHVRDVLFEIRSIYCVSGAAEVEVFVSGTEDTFTPVAYAAYFDAIPADVMPTDQNSYAVSGLTFES